MGEPHQSRQWTNLLISKITPIVQNFYVTYYVNWCTWCNEQDIYDEKKIVAYYQEFCLNLNQTLTLDDWKKQYKSLMSDKNIDIENLWGQVYVNELYALATLRTNQKITELKIKVPQFKVFIEYVYEKVGHFAAKYYHLFIKTKNHITNAQNHLEASQHIEKIILQTLLELLPVNTLTQIQNKHSTVPSKKSPKSIKRKNSVDSIKSNNNRKLSKKKEIEEDSSDTSSNYSSRRNSVQDKIDESNTPSPKGKSGEWKTKRSTSSVSLPKSRSPTNSKSPEDLRKSFEKNREIISIDKNLKNDTQTDTFPITSIMEKTKSNITTEIQQVNDQLTKLDLVNDQIKLVDQMLEKENNLTDVLQHNLSLQAPPTKDDEPILDEESDDNDVVETSQNDQPLTKEDQKLMEEIIPISHETKTPLPSTTPQNINLFSRNKLVSVQSSVETPFLYTPKPAIINLGNI